MSTQRDELLRELKAAHLIIRKMLTLMTGEQKFALTDQLEAAGITGEGITRAYEREAAIARAEGFQPAEQAKASEAIEALAAARKLAADQAEDPGLWFEATTATEAYLQNALRALAAAVEVRHV